MHFIITLTFYLLMLGDNLNPQKNLTQQLFADWLNPSTGRRSRSQSKAFMDEYQQAQHPTSFGSGMIEKLINVSDVAVEESFAKEFMYGKTM